MSGAYSWHEEAWRLAHSALKRGAHALLIAGARGLGKGEFALDLAAAYLCASRDSGSRACGNCSSCHWLAAGTHPDFALVERPTDDDAAEKSPASAARARPIGVDQVRGLTAMLSVSAHHEAGKVVIIRPAEALNLAASNALLKNLEEPPPRVLFLLVADRPALLLPTVRSRCQTVPVRLRDSAAAAAWLREQGVDEPELELSLSGGAPLEAAAIAADPEWQKRHGFLSALTDGGWDPIRVAESFRDLAPALALGWLQKWTYDLILMRFCARVRYHVDMHPCIERIASRLDPVRVARLHRMLLAFQRHVHHPLNARLFVEHILIEYARAVNQARLPA